VSPQIPYLYVQKTYPDLLAFENLNFFNADEFREGTGLLKYYRYEAAGVF
jgi:hypothetical protein